MQKRFDEMNEAERRTFNQCAREQMKLRLLADIRTDLMICEIEGWDKREYINELQKLLNSIKLC